MPWEFTSSMPIRSIVFSGLVSLPYTVLRWLDPFFTHYFKWSLVTPTILLVAPRVYITILSFIADFCVFQIARLCYIYPWRILEVFASSYVMLVFGTRTFSNTMELILMCVVLWRICLSIVSSTKIIRYESQLKELYDASSMVKERVRIARTKSSLPSYNYSDSLLLSVVITYGTFVRPTFVLFTFVPLAYWLQRGIVTKNLDFSYFNRRCLSLLPGVVLTGGLCIVFDSFYYESLTLRELAHGNITALSFTVTPVNFLIYNKDTKNLAQHGLHPHYLNFLVNLPLLYGVLALVGLYEVVMFLSDFLGPAAVHRKPKVYCVSTLLIFSYFVPVLVLSFAPHQEPRFLLPVLPCLVLLAADKVSLSNLFKFRFKKHYLVVLWHSWNLLCVLFFGFLHQGGVTSAVFNVQKYIESSPLENHSIPVHIYFSHMYTPPTFLLMRKVEVLGKSPHGSTYKVPRSVSSHHLTDIRHISALNEILFKRLDTRPNVLHGAGKKSPTPEVLLCLPGSVGVTLDSDNPRKLNFTLIESIPWHISLENLPRYHPHLKIEGCSGSCTAQKLFRQLTMDIYKVELPVP